MYTTVIDGSDFAIKPMNLLHLQYREVLSHLKHFLNHLLPFPNLHQSILKKEGLRCEVDEKTEKIGYKIRTAQLE